MAVGGELVKVGGLQGGRILSRRSGQRGGRHGGGRRGRVVCFSRDSRRRLMRLLASIDKRHLEPPLFVTLTYPSTWPSDPSEWKRHLANFIKCIRRWFPAVSVVWRLEFQARGAPHFHLLVFGVAYLNWKWVRGHWFRIVGSGDLRHFEAGTRVERVKTWARMRSYVSKYVGKLDQAAAPDGAAGRFWGVSGLRYLPISWAVVEVGDASLVRVKRCLRKWLQKRGLRLMVSRPCGLTVFLGWEVASRLVEVFL